MKLTEVDFSNYKIAIEIQRKIFPQEDGTLNLLASLDRNKFIERTGLNYIDDHVKYYIASKNHKVVGITGLYNYGDDFENVWIGWFGILSEYRLHGLGSELLLATINLAKKRGFKYIRLYADINENKEAIKLYEKTGFIKEKYSAEELDYDCYIFSKNLVDDTLPLWNNKLLFLKHQSELDQADASLIEKALKLYE